MTNKKLGNDFENEVCEILAKHGFIDREVFVQHLVSYVFPAIL